MSSLALSVRAATVTLDVGGTFVDALTAGGDACEDSWERAEWRSVRDDCLKGSDLTDALARRTFFPPEFVEVAAAMERHGSGVAALHALALLL